MTKTSKQHAAIQSFKMSLHEEIEKTFHSLLQQDTITTNQFRDKTEQLYKKVFENTKHTGDTIFSNDGTVRDTYKRSYEQFLKDTPENLSNDKKYDERIMPVIETINMLSFPTTYVFEEFGKTLSDSIKFLFTAYAIIFSQGLPKWVDKFMDFDTNLFAKQESAMMLKNILVSIGEDLVQCFHEANINGSYKVSLTMLYASEIQDSVITKVSELLSAKDISNQMSAKMILKTLRENKIDNLNKIDKTKLLDSLEELALKELDDPQFIEKNRNKIYLKILRIYKDLFMANFTSHLIGSPYKPSFLDTETKMKMIDIKNSIIRELEAEFDRIK